MQVSWSGIGKLSKALRRGRTTRRTGQMIGKANPLLVMGIVAVLLCSTPLLRSSPTSSAMNLHSHLHSHGASATDHQHDLEQAMPMQMVFEYGYQTSIWFSSLRTDTPASYIAVLIGLGLLAFVHEGLTVYRKARAELADQFDLLREPK